MIAGQFGMKRNSQDVALPDHDRVLVHRCQHIDVSSRLGNTGCTNEDGPEGAVQPINVEVGLKRLILTAECVPFDDGIQNPELWLGAIGDTGGEENHAGTGAEGRQPICDRLPQRLDEPVNGGQFPDCGRFTSGNDQGIDTFEILGTPNRFPTSTNRDDGVGVLTHVALEGEYADNRHAYQPLVCNSSESLSVPISMPTIASPSPADTLAMVAGVS